MSGADLTVDVAGLRLRNPTMLASGILGYSTETLKSIEDAGAGGVVTKSVCLRPREGYANPTIVQVEGGLINAMGLPNPGINEFAKEIRQAKSILNVPVVVSVFGFSAEEYASVSRRAAAAGADAVELNVSCPHVKETGSEIGQDAGLVDQVVRKVKSSMNKPVIIKLSPNVTSITEIAQAAEKAGANAVTIMNTVRAMAINADTAMPILANEIGGLSGPAIKPIALRCVYDVFDEIDIPIVGCGGITEWRDAVEFLLAGASAVQIGTALSFGKADVFADAVSGIRGYLKTKRFSSVKEIVGQAHRS